MDDPVGDRQQRRAVCHEQRGASVEKSPRGLGDEEFPPTFGQQAGRRPYFETLIVTGVSANNWPGLATEWRKLRRPADAFI